MNTESIKPMELVETTPLGALDRLLRSRLLAQMNLLRDTQLRIVDALGEIAARYAGGESGRRPCMRRCMCTTPRSIAHVAGNGSVGAGEAYMDGLWHCDDLVALMRMLVRNRDLLDAMETGLARLGGVR